MKALKGSKTHDNLKAAFAGESQANRRYLYFAASRTFSPAFSMARPALSAALSILRPAFSAGPSWHATRATRANSARRVFIPQL